MSSELLFKQYTGQSSDNYYVVSHGDGHSDGHTDSTNGTIYQDSHTDYHSDRSDARS